MEALLQSWFSGPLGTALVRLLNMSAAAGALICAAVLLRALLRRAPKWTRGILWAAVAVQLVCPFSLRSPLSVYGILPRSEAVRSDQVEVFRAGGGSEKPLLVLEAPQIAGYEPGIEARPRAGADVPDPAAQAQGAPSVYLPAAGAVWLAGVALMLLYALVSSLTLRRRVRTSIPLADPRFRLCDSVDTPFILGVVRPRIYLPAGLGEAQRSAVAAHETAHLRRGDHWWKLLGWLLLALHWFNPLVWLAYVLFCRDVELACDERAVRGLDAAARADYSQALLDCAAPRPLVRVCPLAFGEVGVKARIKAVLNYRKPAFWLIALAVVACIVLAVCFLTRPAPIRAPEPSDPAVTPTQGPAAPRFEAFSFDEFHAETAHFYFLDEEFYPDSDDPFRSFYLALDMDSGMSQYYETPLSSLIGLGVFTLDGDILTIDDSRSVNRFRMEEDGEKLVWLAEGSDNFTFVKLTDGATFRRRDAEAPPRRMTLEDVRTLASKGEALTWEDLLAFEGENHGSGMYIYRFPIDGEYCLEAFDGKLTGAPRNVRLLAADENGVFRDGVGLSVDIRTEDLDAFLARDRGPYLTVMSGGQAAAAVPHLLYERRWTGSGWLYADGSPAQTLLEQPERIPTLTLADDFAVTFGGGAVRMGTLAVYDEQFTPLREGWYGDTALNWLDAGTYLCGLAVHGPLGRYIAGEDAWEESAYLCVFRLTVPEGDRPAPYTPAEAHDLTEATLRAAGEAVTVTDAGALAQLESWLSGAAVLPGGTACPFGSVLTLTRADGRTFSLCPAEDSCGTVFAGGTYYRCAADNAAFWRIFGVTPD